MEHVRPTQLFVSEEPSPPPAPPPRPTPADRKAKFEQAQDKLQRARSVAAAREFARGRAIVLLQRRARKYLHLTRERRSAAATTVQQQARRMIATKVTQRTPTTTARSSRSSVPRSPGSRRSPPASGSRVSSRRSLFEATIASVHASEELSPFSSTYVGHAEHRRRIEESLGGRLQKYGSPNEAALARALPGQLETALNTLRFVDAVNALLSRPGLLSPGQAGVDGALLSSLIEWADGTLQQRFSGAAQYLRSAKKFRLISFEGEYPLPTVWIKSRCIGASRRDLLDVAMKEPRLIVPSTSGEDDLIRMIEGRQELSLQMDSFLGGSFEGDVLQFAARSSPAAARAMEAHAAAERRSPSLQRERSWLHELWHSFGQRLNQMFVHDSENELSA